MACRVGDLCRVCISQMTCNTSPLALRWDPGRVSDSPNRSHRHQNNGRVEVVVIHRMQEKTLVKLGKIKVKSYASVPKHEFSRLFPSASLLA